MDYEKLATQRYELENAPEIWQFDLLTPQKLCQFAKDRDIPVYNADTVTALWRVGLLRADRITATSKLEIPAIELVSENDGLFIYCDKRRVEHRIQSYGGTLAGMESVSGALGSDLDFTLWRAEAGRSRGQLQ